MTMTDADRVEREERELREELERLIVDKMRAEWAKNTAIWLGVVIGSMAIVLGVLQLVTSAG
jgi:hypothetical protein